MNIAILNVYFSGSNHQINDGTHLGSTLHDATINDEGELKFKMGFHGCGITNGLMGALFGAGLEAQCDEVIELIQAQLRLGNRVRVNAYGHSRGGIAALMLAKRLGQYSEDIVETNLCLMDPVPGNFIWTSTIDFTHRSLARQTMNLTDCRNIKKVLVLYPNEPLASTDAHAPLLCDYPENCEVIEEIMPGCHAGAQFTIEMDSESYRKIAFSRCYQFLKNCGATFSVDYLYWNTPYHFNADDQDALLLTYQSEFKKAKSANETTRACHVKRGTAILARPQEANFLSVQHAELFARSNPDAEPAPCIPLYSFSRPRPQYAPKPATILNSVNIKNLFEGAVVSLSLKNTEGKKGKRINALIQSFKSVTDENSHDYLRNGLAIFLQRDNQVCGLFSKTSSGKALLNSLNTNSEYAAIKQTILGGQKDRSLRYEDLRCYVLGRNDKTFFAQKNANTLFAEFKESAALLKNHMQHFLSR